MDTRRWFMAVAATVLVAMSACVESASDLGVELGMHKCAGAGRWFPSDPEELRETVEKSLAAAKPFKTDKPVIGMVAPHAGYEWSGDVAGYAYRTVKGARYSRVVVLAPSHGLSFRGVSVGMYKAFETPLGDVPVDTEACRSLLDKANGLFVLNSAAHTTEHSLENHLPFLQVALGEFSLVPLVIGYLRPDDYAAVADAVRPLLDGKTLIVASSDFTHYGRSFRYEPFPLDAATGKKLEGLATRAIKSIERTDPAGFRSYLDDTSDTICGRVPIGVFLEILEGRADGHMLKYGNSGSMTGDFAHAVSYASIVFTPSKKQLDIPADEIVGGGELDDDEQATLLKLARRSLQAHFGTAAKPEPGSSEFPLTPKLKTPLGVFVTLKKQGILRGCIGHIEEGKIPLHELVAQYVIQSAVGDPRFKPMTEDEVDDVHIEISVMCHVDTPTSPFKECENVNDIVIGRDGLLLTLGRYRGIFLPQVPVEQKWTLEQYLDGICRKAGLPQNAHTHPAAQLSTFSAQVFGEKR